MIGRLILATLWTTATLIGLGWPASDLPSVNIDDFDKIAHFVLFFVFGFLWMFALPLHPEKKTWLVLIVGIVFAVGTELYQGLLPTDRTPDLWDVVADVFGLCMGIMFYHILTFRKKSSEVYR